MEYQEYHTLSREISTASSAVCGFPSRVSNVAEKTNHQFSQTDAGRTVLMMLQWPAALWECHRTKSPTCPTARTLCWPSSTFSKDSASISNSGIRYISLDLLPRKSASVGFRNSKGESVRLQKITILVKSPAQASAVGSLSRKIRQL